jgi:hypothetical protein
MEKGATGIKQSYEELSYTDQAKSLNTQILAVEKAINTHLRRASSEGKDMYETREKYISQLERIIKGIG